MTPSSPPSRDPPPEGFSKMIALTEETIDQALERKLQEIGRTDKGGLDREDMSQRYQASKRRLLCDQLRREHLEIHDVREVFISYSGTGGDLFRTASEYFQRHGFKPRHGDESEVKSGDYIPRDIISIIKQCSCFLAIWTKTYEAQSFAFRGLHGNDVGSSRGFIPSVWMPFELGVAMSLNKPYKVMVEDGTLTDFLEKPNLGNSKIVFKHVNFERELRYAKDHFERRLVETRSRLALPDAEVGAGDTQ